MSTPTTTGSAILSPDGVHRYVLERQWQAELTGDRGRCLFVMLNPSTADALDDDPTVRRCVGFASDWGFATLAVVNLFAYRSTSPETIRAIALAEAIGEDNDHWIEVEARRADLIVAAWGVNGSHYERDRDVMRILGDHAVHVYALGLANDGSPRHPLYMAGAAEPSIYFGRP